MSLKSQTRDPQLKVPPKDLCSGFLRPEKIHRPQSGLNTRTLDFEASTLLRDHRGRLNEGVNKTQSPEMLRCINDCSMLDKIKNEGIRKKKLNQ